MAKNHVPLCNHVSPHVLKTYNRIFHRCVIDCHGFYRKECRYVTTVMCYKLHPMRYIVTHYLMLGFPYNERGGISTFYIVRDTSLKEPNAPDSQFLFIKLRSRLNYKQQLFIDIVNFCLVPFYNSKVLYGSDVKYMIQFDEE